MLPPTGKVPWWKSKTKVEAASNTRAAPQEVLKGSNGKGETKAIETKDEVLYKLEPLYLTYSPENQASNPSSDLEHADRSLWMPED